MIFKLVELPQSAIFFVISFTNNQMYLHELDYLISYNLCLLSNGLLVIQILQNIFAIKVCVLSYSPKCDGVRAI